MGKKCISYFLSVVVFAQFLFGSSVYGQPSDQQGDTKTLQEKTIFDYKKELKLTDNQEREIRNLLNRLAKENQKNRARLVLLNSEIEELIKSEGDLNTIKSKLNEAAIIQAAIAYSNIEFSRNINKTLTPDQIKKWKEIRESARKKQ